MRNSIFGGTNQRSAFTLVEILIVVSILGILASIVIPRFSSATETAKYSSLKNTVKIVRSQITMYQTQHGGQWPNLTGSDGWDLLTEKTLEDQTVDAAGSLGPYLQKVPINPFTGSSLISADSSSPQDWLYDSTTGEFKAFMSSEDYDRLSEEDSDIVTYIVTPPSS